MDYEFKFDIAGVEYTHDDIVSARIHQPLFQTFGAGNACSAEMSITVFPKATIPRMAKIIAYGKAVNEDKWTRIGVFYTDTRSSEIYGTSRITTLNAFDAMLMTEQVYQPEGETGEWPRLAASVLSDISTRTKIEVDERTALKSYYIDYPNEYTMREMLCHIAAAHGGNWIITAQGKLLLVPLFTSAPLESNYLVYDDGSPLLFGDVRILL